MDGNLVIFTIIIVLFIVLAGIGFGLWYVNNRLSNMAGSATSATSTGIDV
jgi:Kef-type K+ transport system membrane component KefB